MNKVRFIAIYSVNGLYTFVLKETVERSPVPNEGACDWGLNSFLSPVDPICEICQLYYDGRTNNTHSMQDCVWVPLYGKCYPKNYAVNQNFTYDESCEGFNF